MKILKKIFICLFIIILAGIYSYGNWERPLYDTDIGSNSYTLTPEIQDDVKQTFVCPENGLNGIQIKVNFGNVENLGVYEWFLYDEEEKIVAQDGITSEMVGEKKYLEKNILELKFEKQRESKGQKYMFVIKNNNPSEDGELGCYMTLEGKYSEKLAVDGNWQDQSLIIKQEIQMFNIETFIVFLGLAGYILFFIKYMYKLFK